MNAPLYEHLINYSKKQRVSFSMPGHKGKINNNLIKTDVTELIQTADLHSESYEVTLANNLLSKLYNTKQSFILTSGSTTAIQAMIASSLKKGDTLLISSDCHMSVINTCAFLGINVRIADKDFDSEFLIPSKLCDIEKYLSLYPDIRAVLITSPNYYGICCDIEKLALQCHKHHIPLLVDEAHGAHFVASDKFPESATQYADLVCNSAHKTLNALTGAAYLHVCGDLISPHRVRECINIFESSSPSYMIAASADLARSELETKLLFDKSIDLCDNFKSETEKLNISVLYNDDPLRLVLNFNNFEISGFEVEKILSDSYGIDIEMADSKNIVMIVTHMNQKSDFDMLYDALKKITSNIQSSKEALSLMPPKHNASRLIRPHLAFMCDTDACDIKNSCGRVSSQNITVYPPGIPIIIMGSEITQNDINTILSLKQNGAKITGLSDENTIQTVSGY